MKQENSQVSIKKNIFPNFRTALIGTLTTSNAFDFLPWKDFTELLLHLSF